MTKAKRFNEGKPMISTIAPDVMEYLTSTTGIKLFMEAGTPGAIKYDTETRLNYMLGGKPELEYINSAARHILAWMEGEKVDPETKARHLSHAYWNLTVLQYMLDYHNCVRKPVCLHVRDYLNPSSRSLLLQVHALAFTYNEEQSNLISECRANIERIIEDEEGKYTDTIPTFNERSNTSNLVNNDDGEPFDFDFESSTPCY